MATEEQDKYPENIASDRDILPLSSGNSKMSGYMFIVAAVIGVGVFAWTQMSGNQRVKVVEAPSYKPSAPDTTALPDLQEAPTNVETRALPEKKVDPFELEKLRQKHALELERLKNAQRRMEDARKEAEARRKSPMVIVNDDAASGRSATASQLSTGSDALSGPLSYDPNGLLSTKNINEVYNDRGERFLRDAGNADVVEASAVTLPNQDTLITQGTFISGVLETAINSDLPGMVRALVDTPVYSRTGRVKLIPKGSRLIGKYQSGMQEGQTRVFIAWTRLERPDGIVIDLGSNGADTLGRAGLGGDVNTHFFKRFGAAALLSVIGPTVALLVENENSSQNESQIIQAGTESFNKSAEIALENSIKIPPTVSVDQGTRINVFVARDLSFYNALRRG